MRRSGLRKRAAADATSADIGLNATATRPYDPFEPAQIETLIGTAKTYLNDIGIRFEPGTEADVLFAAAGCRVRDDGVVHIPPHVVDAALASCARSTKLWGRDGHRAIDIDTRHTWFMPGMTCIKVPDLESGVRRDSTYDDLAAIARIADGLPNIDAVCVACKDVPNSNLGGEIGEFLCLIENTTKPLEYLCEQTAALEAAIEMAALLRGGRAELAAKPYFLHLVTPLPVNFAASHIEQILIGARAGVPLSVGTLAIGGASSPITVAGCIAQCLATDFAALVLGQLARPGAFCVGSSNGYFMEAATGGIGNNTQLMLGEQMICQCRRHLGLPSFTGIGGDAKSPRFDQDAVWEISTLMTQQFFTRPATCDYLGSIDQGITFSLHALLLCHDLAGMLRQLWQGAGFDRDGLAYDVMADVGPFGHFLGHTHTAAHCREANWASAYFGARAPLSTNDVPAQSLFARIDADLRERLRAEPC
ncbi:MAG: trimethylamine methyltransferase family protein, partial [Albidovulum sp.]